MAETFVCTCRPDDAEHGCAYCMGARYVLATDYAELQSKLDAVLSEVHHVKRWNHRLIELLSAIHMRCTPEDVKLEDGRTMRFVPPDPEFYWRELSAKVKAVEAEMRAINEAEEAALTDQGRAGEGRGDG